MKRLLIRAPLLAITLFAAPLFAEVTVPVTTDLEADGKLAHERNLPLLVMFFAEDCPYCVKVEEDFLEPMLISGDYEEKVIIRRVNYSRYGQLTDFNGESIPVSEFAARYEVRVTPTLIYVDGHGKRLAKTMVGLTTPDFYGGYIDRRIETALGNLCEAPAGALALEESGAPRC